MAAPLKVSVAYSVAKERQRTTRRNAAFLPECRKFFLKKNWWHTSKKKEAKTNKIEQCRIPRLSPGGAQRFAAAHALAWQRRPSHRAPAFCEQVFAREG